ncbi:exodeoxyribonuclease VII small subunit [Orrella marina]|uniref:exodeoxyribonuclease VII small subunit n=1 Tax=Orrella marina TaxID=2163011 RepID=UPI001D1324BB|nr:exodeoxyribonuclease VII small subunit [Orrella marina]
MSQENKTGTESGQNALPDDFESALRELEQCVATMERGDLTLEASLAAYQRGVALTQICQRKLSVAQQKVQVLESDLLKPLSLDQEDR